MEKYYTIPPPFFIFIIRKIFIVFRERSEVYFAVCIVKCFWLPVSGLGNLRNLRILTVLVGHLFGKIYIEGGISEY
jgi:hypothetical protein